MAKKETKAQQAARVQEVLRLLDEEYGTDFRCYLNHETPWQLLIAVILSAQCTDARVNIVTEDLFKKYDSIEKFAQADLKELEQDIHSTGFYHNKAKNIIACCKDLIERFHGEVPSAMEDLTSLAGVGRKTANVIRGNIYGEPSIVVDTHVKRISRKLGFAREQEPEKIEYELMKVLPRDHWILWNIQIITLGRSICFARSPKCGDCFLWDCCPGAAVDTRPGAKTESEASAKPGTKTKSEAKTKSRAAAKPGTKTKSEAKTKSRAAAKPGTKTESKAKTKSGTAAKPGAKTESEAAKAGAEFESGTGEKL